MPFDKFFSQSGGQSGRALARKAARERIKVLQQSGDTKLEMRLAGELAWEHFLNVSAESAGEEIRAWEQSNPGFEFRVAKSA